MVSGGWQRSHSLHLALALVSLKARHAVLGLETESPLCCPGDHPIEFMVNYPPSPCQFLPSESGGPGRGACTAAPPTQEHRPLLLCTRPVSAPVTPQPVPSLQGPPLLEGGRLPREETDRPTPSSVHFGLRPGREGLSPPPSAGETQPV